MCISGFNKLLIWHDKSFFYSLVDATAYTICRRREKISWKLPQQVSLIDNYECSVEISFISEMSRADQLRGAFLYDFSYIKNLIVCLH